jgi:hypothetical protein
MKPTRQIRNGVGLMATAAVGVSAYSMNKSHSLHLYLALTVLALAALTSRMRVKLPGINGNMSVNLPFLLLAIVNLSAAESVVIACVSTFVQCWPKKGTKFKPEQMLFNLSMIAFASCLANLIFHVASLPTAAWRMPLALALATATMLFGQTVPVAAMVAISEGKPAFSTWRNLLQLSFPYYVVSAGVASMLESAGNQVGWAVVLAAFPVMYGIHACYRFYFSKMAEAGPAPVLVRAAHA